MRTGCVPIPRSALGRPRRRSQLSPTLLDRHRLSSLTSPLRLDASPVFARLDLPLSRRRVASSSVAEADARSVPQPTAPIPSPFSSTPLSRLQTNPSTFSRSKLTFLPSNDHLRSLRPHSFNPRLSFDRLQGLARLSLSLFAQTLPPPSLGTRSWRSFLLARPSPFSLQPSPSSYLSLDPFLQPQQHARPFDRRRAPRPPAAGSASRSPRSVPAFTPCYFRELEVRAQGRQLDGLPCAAFLLSPGPLTDPPALVLPFRL